jgi:hypothetical protein
MQRLREIPAWNLRFGGIRRNACTKSRRLISRRSQVQILPRYCEDPGNRAFSLERPNTALALQALLEVSALLRVDLGTPARGTA